MMETIQVWRTDRERVVLKDGHEMTVPEDWEFVPSGDPGLTRRLKTLGDCWCVVHRRKNRLESTGLWTSAALVRVVKKRLEAERATPEYKRRLEAERKRREAEEDAYVVRFRQAVVDYLNFAPCYTEKAWLFADVVTDQAIPVGSGTVARTETIPLEARAEAAVIAWMRHQTTAYDMMSIGGEGDRRRDVRRRLAGKSRALLERYRKGEPILPDCPLAWALGWI